MKSWGKLLRQPQGVIEPATRAPFLVVLVLAVLRALPDPFEDEDENDDEDENGAAVLITSTGKAPLAPPPPVWKPLPQQSYGWLEKNIRVRTGKTGRLHGGYVRSRWL
jgi:hypothetical protein